MIAFINVEFWFYFILSLILSDRLPVILVSSHLGRFDSYVTAVILLVYCWYAVKHFSINHHMETSPLPRKGCKISDFQFVGDYGLAASLNIFTVKGSRKINDTGASLFPLLLLEKNDAAYYDVCAKMLRLVMHACSFFDKLQPNAVCRYHIYAPLLFKIFINRKRARNRHQNKGWSKRSLTVASFKIETSKFAHFHREKLHKLEPKLNLVWWMEIKI